MIIGKTDDKRNIELLPQMANKHGLISGATGTGKTVTLRVLAENFSKLGVPVFMADVKGDLSGIAKIGQGFEARGNLFDIGFEHRAYPALFWDLYGVKGHPIRTALHDLGPLLTSRLMDLNKVQTGVLTLAWKVANEQFPNTTMLSLYDLKKLLRLIGDNAYDFSVDYGNVNYTTIGVIQRAILELEHQNVNEFFNIPKFNIKDLFSLDNDNKGVIHLLNAQQLINNPVLYSTFLLWLLSELYETLDEVGDLEKPLLVFCFDEAHLLFKNIPLILLNKVEQIVRLIRSKGIGIFFITQNPLDIPKTIASQLGNKIQHALRAFTPEEYNNIIRISQTFRTNLNVDIKQSMTNMRIGEALVSFLQEDGSPMPVEKVYIAPPESRLEPLTEGELQTAIKNSPLYGKYETGLLTEEQKMGKTTPPNKEAYFEQFGKSMVRTMGNQVGRELVRGIFYTFMRGLRKGIGR